MMEAEYYSETPVSTYKNARQQNPETHNLNNRRETLKTYTLTSAKKYSTGTYCLQLQGRS
jgi:hypothetical protein